MTAYRNDAVGKSQERMLAVLKPGREHQAEAIFKKCGSWISPRQWQASLPIPSALVKQA